MTPSADRNLLLRRVKSPLDFVYREQPTVFTHRVAIGHPRNVIGYHAGFVAPGIGLVLGGQ